MSKTIQNRRSHARRLDIGLEKILQPVKIAATTTELSAADTTAKSVALSYAKSPIDNNEGNYDDKHAVQ